MRQVVLYIATSLDGYIAKENGDTNFLKSVENRGEDYGYRNVIKTVDTVIMGRKTYEKIQSFGINFPHTDKKCYVLSKSKTGKDENVEFYGGSITKLISGIRKKKGLNIFIDGGSETILSLIKQNLIDNFIISVIPVLLGGGIPLFKSGFQEQKLKLVKCIPFKSGLVQLWYDRKIK